MGATHTLRDRRPRKCIAPSRHGGPLQYHPSPPAALVIAKALESTAEKAPDKGLWESVGDILVSVGEFLAEHAGTIGAIAGLLALFPPLPPFMAPIALVASAVSMGKNLLDEDFRKNLMFQGSKMEIFSAWASVAGDAVGIIPGGKPLGLAAKEGFEGAADGANMAVKTWSGVKGGFFGTGRAALDDANDAWRAAGESTRDSLKLLTDIKVNGLNVAANAISSAESFGAVDKDGAQHNTAEGTKAAATAHGIAGLLGLL